MEARFCQACGNRLVEGACPRCSPMVISTEKVPWYFSRRTKIISFILFTPIWSVLVLANKRTGRGEKIFAGIVLGIVLLGFASLYIDATEAPGVIKFGTRVESLEVTDPNTSFRDEDKIKWATRLSSPVGTTSILLTLSEKREDGSEVPVGEKVLSVASPDFDKISADLDIDTFASRKMQPGQYVLRMLAREKVVASGAFWIN